MVNQISISQQGKKSVEICSLTNSIRAIKKKSKKIRATQENNTQLLDEVFVIIGIIKVEVSDISQAEGRG